MKSSIITLLLLILTAVSLSGETTTEDQNDDGTADLWVDTVNGITTAIRGDMDYNGEIDYIADYDEEGYLKMESLDTNGDALMDDYYHYSRGVLVKRELDTNFDEQIDIWVYLSDGVYIRKYERDFDFDGEIDKVKVFGEEGEN